MNISDIIGPIMIGPSSSHTAGVVKIGLLVNRILDYSPKNVTVVWYGSFAKTYVGHGSDKAIIAGLLGMNTFDERIRNSLEIAQEEGLKFSFQTASNDGFHPNTLKIISYNDNGDKKEILASSLGGGAAVIKKIDDIDVYIDGSYDTIFIKHKDEKGVIKEVTDILYKYHINIATMRVLRSEKSGKAIMLIEIDDKIGQDGLCELEKVKNIDSASVIKKV